MSNRKSVRTKALLAIVFAGCSSGHILPAVAERVSSHPQSTVQQIMTSNLTPTWKAYNLLTLAVMYLSQDDATTTTNHFSFSGTGVAGNVLSQSRRLKNNLTDWAEAMSLTPNDLAAGKPSKNSLQKKICSASAENRASAIAAITKAVELTDQDDDPFAKLNLKYIASLLYLQAGDVDKYQKCKKSLDDVITSCESHPLNGSEQLIKSAASVLNTMAYGIIPVKIPDQHPPTATGLKPLTEVKFTKKQFEDSEKLRLRALTMVDQLKPTAYVRRRQHRDMSLWYALLGKTDQSEEQKKIVFELVGINNDEILWPVRGTCGALAWWILDGKALYAECGMG